jgi:hypothetical protein
MSFEENEKYGQPITINEDLNTYINNDEPQQIIHVVTYFGTDETLAQIAAAFGKCIKNLDLRGNTKISSTGFQQHLPNFVLLQKLNLACNPNVNDDVLMYVANLTSLTSLNLTRTHVGDAGLEHIANLHSLQTLLLVNTNISDAGLQHVAKLPSLEVLFLADTNITNAGLAHLADLVSLRQLFLYNTRISDSGLRYLAKLPSLEPDWVVTQGTAVTAEGLEYFKAAVPVLQEAGRDPNAPMTERVELMMQEVRRKGRILDDKLLENGEELLKAKNEKLAQLRAKSDNDAKKKKKKKDEENSITRFMLCLFVFLFCCFLGFLFYFK